MPETTLPHVSDRDFIADGGMETYLIYERGLELPEFASFPLLDSAEGRAELRAYFEPFLRAAADLGTGFVLDTPTWRANPDWGAKLGYDVPALIRVNTEAVRFMREIAEGSGLDHVIVDGAIGPRGDGYAVSDVMDPYEAADYHRPQIDAFVAGGVDMVTGYTINYVDEGIGIARAASEAGVPVVISFTTETDGRLPSGESLGEAIERVDAAVPGAVASFMVNCAHPTHFEGALPDGAAWLGRISGVRANASARSHAELDASTELDPGDPEDLGQRYAGLRTRLPSLRVFGGCCGTDARHVRAIGDAAIGALATA